MGLKKLGCFSIGAFVFFVLTVGAARPQEDHSHNEGAAHSHDEGSTHSHDEASKAATSQKGSEETKAATVASKGNASKGKELFQQQCELCHEAESNTATVGPGLKGLFHMAAHKRADGTEMAHHDEPTIRKQIEEGTGSMPPMKDVLSKEQMDDLIAYLRTL